MQSRLVQALNGLNQKDPRQELQTGLVEYLELIKDTLEKAKETKSAKEKDDLLDLVQAMIANYEKLNDAKRVVLGIPPNA